MALYIPHTILHSARLLYVRPGNFGPYYVGDVTFLHLHQQHTLLPLYKKFKRSKTGVTKITLYFLQFIYEIRACKYCLSVSANNTIELGITRLRFLNITPFRFLQLWGSHKL